MGLQFLFFFSYRKMLFLAECRQQENYQEEKHNGMYLEKCACSKQGENEIQVLCFHLEE